MSRGASIRLACTAQVQAPAFRLGSQYSKTNGSARLSNSQWRLYDLHEISNGTSTVRHVRLADPLCAPSSTNTFENTKGRAAMCSTSRGKSGDIWSFSLMANWSRTVTG